MMQKFNLEIFLSTSLTLFGGNLFIERQITFGGCIVKL